MTTDTAPKSCACLTNTCAQPWIEFNDKTRTIIVHGLDDRPNVAKAIGQQMVELYHQVAQALAAMKDAR